MSEQVQDPQGQDQNQQPQGEPQQFAGKFNSAEELEKGYLELQKKLGDRPKAAEPKAPEQAPIASDDYEWQKKNAVLDAQQFVHQLLPSR